MMTIQRLDFRSLDSYRFSEYEKMTAEKFRCYLSHNPPHYYPDANPVSIGIESDGKPIAVAHLTFHTNNKIAELHTFAIAEGAPFTQTAEKLLHDVEGEIGRLHCSLAVFHFPKGSPLSLVFIRHGWSDPALYLYRINFDPPTFTTPWLHKEYPLPEGSQLFPWRELTSHEREMLKNQERECRFHYSVSPFGDEKYLQPLNSFGLRYGGEVVGWMVTHSFPGEPHAIRYSSLYIDSDHQFKGLSIRLLQKAILEQQRHPEFTAAYCEVNMDHSDRNWKRFLKRRLIPYSLSVVETMQTAKIFT